MKNKALIGSILVALGASSYGMLTTFVKLAGEENFNVYEIILCEYLLGAPLLFLFSRFTHKKRKKNPQNRPTKKNIRNLLLAGSSMGVTTLVYYYSVQFIDVSIAIVLLMQSVWIGVLFDAIINKSRPGTLKIVAVIVVLAGTILATNLLFNKVSLDWRGVALGLTAALSYSITIMATNRIATNLPSITRSQWMANGALIFVLIFTLPFLVHSFHPKILYSWGIFFGAFGCFIPALLLNYGMPKVNLGVGAIISSMELPVAVSLAFFILDEKVNGYQWLGIIMILLAIVGMNLKKIRRKKKIKSPNPN